MRSRGGRAVGRGEDRRQRGQATVEIALALPLVLLLVLAVVQVGLVVRDQVLVVHAAREGARAAAVHRELGPVVDAAVDGSGLAGERMDVLRGPRGTPGSTVRVTVRYRSATVVPLIGPMIPDVPLEASMAMRVER